MDTFKLSLCRKNCIKQNYVNKYSPKIHLMVKNTGRVLSGCNSGCLFKKTYQNTTSRFHIWFPQENVAPDLVHAAQSCCPAELPWGLKWVLLRCCYSYLSFVPSPVASAASFSEGQGQKGRGLPR